MVTGLGLRTKDDWWSLGWGLGLKMTGGHRAGAWG